MTLYRYYTLEESNEVDLVIDKLNEYVNTGKISYEIDEDDILIIEDLDLLDEDIEELKEFFNENDVYEFIDREDSYFNNREDNFLDDDDYDEWN